MKVALFGSIICTYVKCFCLRGHNIKVSTVQLLVVGTWMFVICNV